jgi:hypothetical protein
MSESTGRTEVIKSYVSEQTKQDLEREADQRGESLSSLADEYIRRGLRQDRTDAMAAETEAERHIQDLVDRGVSEVEKVSRQIREQHAKSAVYGIAAFELLKQKHGEAEVKEALQTGTRRLQEDDIDVEPDESTPSTQNDADDDDGGFWS